MSKRLLTVALAATCWAAPARGAEQGQPSQPGWLRLPVAQPLSPAEQQARGRALFAGRGCAACHRTDGRALVGPPLDHLVGTTVKLKDGSTAPVDEAYLRESIDNPRAKVVEGFEQAMPYLGLSPAEVGALVAYLQSLPPGAPEPAEKLSLPARGQALVQARGCFGCHGAGGAGGVANANSATRTVPTLKNLAEKMLLGGPEDAKAVVAMLEKGPLAEQAKPPFPTYPAVLAQYRAVHTKILEGGKPASEFPRAARPPLAMPAWKGLVTDRDADALIAYLLTLQNWDE